MSELSVNENRHRDYDRRSPTDSPDACCSSSAAREHDQSEESAAPPLKPVIQSEESSAVPPIPANQSDENAAPPSVPANQFHTEQAPVPENSLNSEQNNESAECATSLSETVAGASEDLACCMPQSLLHVIGVTDLGAVCGASHTNSAITPDEALPVTSEVESVAISPVAKDDVADVKKGTLQSTDVTSLENDNCISGDSVQNIEMSAVSDQIDGAVNSGDNNGVSSDNRVDEAVVLADTTCDAMSAANIQRECVNMQEDDIVTVNSTYSNDIQMTIRSHNVPNDSAISTEADCVTVDPVLSINPNVDVAPVSRSNTFPMNVSDDTHASATLDLSEKVLEEVTEGINGSNSNGEASSLAEAVMADTLSATDEYMADIARSIVEDCLRQIRGSFSHPESNNDDVPSVNSSMEQNKPTSNCEVSYEAVSSDVECDIESAIRDVHIAAAEPLETMDDESKTLKRSDSEVSASSCVLPDPPKSSAIAELTASLCSADVVKHEKDSRHIRHLHGRIIDGRQKYERKFLLRFQKQYYPRPANLPNIPEIMRVSMLVILQ